jgi:hypothetical protein
LVALRPIPPVTARAVATIRWPIARWLAAFGFVDLVAKWIAVWQGELPWVIWAGARAPLPVRPLTNRLLEAIPLRLLGVLVLLAWVTMIASGPPFAIPRFLLVAPASFSAESGP